MKKIIALICTLALCITLTACRGDSKGDGKSKLEGLEFTRAYACVDYLNVFNDFEALENASDLVVVGEFIGDSKVCWDTFTNYDNLTSSCLMKITKVLSGDAKVGQLINVLQNEGVLENEFVTGSQLTPMQKGDEWVFCLVYSEAHAACCDGYYCLGDGDIEGRFPTKNADSNQKMCFSDYPELGVYDRANFNERFYSELVEKYGV